MQDNSRPYHELHRPQFHFSPRTGWTNDPNGLVYYEGVYHLFFQHNPESVKWGNMTWGHATSIDLVHWEELDDALHPDALGTIFSGSAVVDWRNISGFGTGSETPLVAFYTSAGSHAPTPCPFTQSIAYSCDRGRTWTKYDGNPVVGHIEGHNRDPKVVWHAPTDRWIMALYLDRNDYMLLGSKNIRDWSPLTKMTLAGVSECPDFFELSVDGNPEDTRWVFWGANGGYRIGRFDGTIFVPETPVLHAERGPNGYAAQTWSDIPDTDGRRIQISWMNGGKYPSMPFNQQMSFPVSLSLKRFGDALRLCRTPVTEIETLYGRQMEYTDQALTDSFIPDTQHNLFDISVSFTPGRARLFGLVVQGHRIECNPEDDTLTAFGRTVPISRVSGRIDLRLLVDRTSVEIFSLEGRLSMSCCFLPEACDVPLEFFATDGVAGLHRLTVRELNSIWT
ncbi:MAG: glycoside hydrolase family 32 protein [candidate division Zixibacteria bacterium]|nr:glycoside hydrolase family 32 protein [candidate division Zixibacteria bacterium]